MTYKKVKITILASVPYETTLEDLNDACCSSDILDVHEIFIEDGKFTTAKEHLEASAKKLGWELRDQFKPKEYR